MFITYISKTLQLSSMNKYLDQWLTICFGCSQVKEKEFSFEEFFVIDTRTCLFFLLLSDGSYFLHLFNSPSPPSGLKLIKENIVFQINIAPRLLNKYVQKQLALLQPFSFWHSFFVSRSKCNTSSRAVLISFLLFITSSTIPRKSFPSFSEINRTFINSNRKIIRRKICLP